jgi:hypothetical protein
MTKPTDDYLPNYSLQLMTTGRVLSAGRLMAPGQLGLRSAKGILTVRGFINPLLWRDS